VGGFGKRQGEKGLTISTFGLGSGKGRGCWGRLFWDFEGGRGDLGGVFSFIKNGWARGLRGS
jgi:hypothetical protein